MQAVQKFLTTRRIVLGPGESTRESWTIGRIGILESTGPFMACFGNAEEIPLDLGSKLDFGGTIHDAVTFRNPSTTATLTFDALFGTGDFADNRFNVVTTRPNQFVAFAEGATIAYARDFTTASAVVGVCEAGEGALPAGDNVPLMATNANFRRKHVIITNLDAALCLTVLGPGLTGGTRKARAAVVFPKSSLLLETSEDLTLLNESGSDIQCTVIESYYWISRLPQP